MEALEPGPARAAVSTRARRARPAAGPLVSDDAVDFVYRDRRARSVRLAPALSRFVTGTDFARLGRTWHLRFPRPPVDRLEYQLEVEYPDGRAWICDPANPLRAPGPFGDKSVIEFPGYRAPEWLGADPPRGEVVDFAVHSRPFRTDIPILVWSAVGAEPGRSLPLLVVHDGPETAEYSSLLLLLDELVARGEVRPFRAALLHPTDRDEHYSASAAYARTLAWDLLPRLADVAPSPQRRRMRIGLGSSLGALALLHAHRRHPETFGALLLQSGSFFRHRTDPHEGGLRRFDRISRFVGRMIRASDVEEPDPIDVTITCGTVEENLANNRAVAGALATQGYGVRFAEVRDSHTWIGWRDAWDPWLIELLRRKWG